MKLITSLYLVSRLILSGVVPVMPYVVTACTELTLYYRLLVLCCRRSGEAETVLDDGNL